MSRKNAVTDLQKTWNIMRSISNIRDIGKNSHSVTIMGFLLMSAFLRPVLGGLGQFLYMHFLDLTLGIRFEPVLGGLSRVKEIASHTSMQMVRSNEKII